MRRPIEFDGQAREEEQPVLDRILAEIGCGRLLLFSKPARAINLVSPAGRRYYRRSLMLAAIACVSGRSRMSLLPRFPAWSALPP